MGAGGKVTQGDVGLSLLRYIPVLLGACAGLFLVARIFVPPVNTWRGLGLIRGIATFVMALIFLIVFIYVPYKYPEQAYVTYTDAVVSGGKAKRHFEIGSDSERRLSEQWSEYQKSKKTGK